VFFFLNDPYVAVCKSCLVFSPLFLFATFRPSSNHSEHYILEREGGVSPFRYTAQIYKTGNWVRAWEIFDAGATLSASALTGTRSRTYTKKRKGERVEECVRRSSAYNGCQEKQSWGKSVTLGIRSCTGKCFLCSCVCSRTLCLSMCVGLLRRCMCCYWKGFALKYTFTVTVTASY